MSHELIGEILTAAGQPIAGHTLTVTDMQKAVEEGRVLEIYLWSSMGDSEASFSFATTFGLDYEGRVHPSYLVFPGPIPPALRRSGASEWEETAEVFEAFGVGPLDEAP